MPRLPANPRLPRWAVRARGAIVAVLVVLLAAMGLWQLSKSRTVQLFGDLVARVETEAPVVALTLDDGPTAAYTGEVLNLLAEYDVPATFFLTGREIEEFPDEARAIVAAGHEIGNHSYSHPRMVFMRPSTVAGEIERTDAAIRAAGYQGEIRFRPPFGKKLVTLPWYLASHGRTSVTWDIEAESDPQVAADTGRLAGHVIANARPGSIIMLHVMYKSREASRAALPAIIEGLRAKGYRFVTVSELIASRTVR